jgi:hypothetical protein
MAKTEAMLLAVTVAQTLAVVAVAVRTTTAILKVVTVVLELWSSDTKLEL